MSSIPPPSVPPPRAPAPPGTGAAFNLTLPSPEGRADAVGAYLARAEDPDAPGVVVIQEILGVNADMRQICDCLAKEGFHALCPDLFWRQRPGAVFSDQNEAERQEALALYREFDMDQGVNDLQSAIGWLGALDGQPRKVGCVGFCLGGLLSYRTAACCRSDAAVVYYGTGIERYLDEASTLACPLLIHLAGDDEFMPPSTRNVLMQALERLPAVELQLYPGVRHAFARHEGRHYESAAAELARIRSLDFLRQHLH